MPQRLCCGIGGNTAQFIQLCGIAFDERMEQGIISLRSGTAPGMRGSDASADCDPKQYACSECSHDPRTEP